MECLPEDLPGKIVVDVSALDINEGITVADLELPGTTEVAMPADTTVVQVITAKAEVVEEPEEEEGEEEGEGEDKAKAEGEGKGEEAAKAGDAEQKEEKPS